MASLWKRLKSSIQADLHGVLDEREQKNPIGTLSQILRECEKETEKVKKLIERQYLLKDEFTKEYEEAVRMAEKRKHQAEVALNAGEEELYKFAQAEITHYEERANRAKAATQTCVKQIEELERKFAEMQHKLKDMYLKRLELMGKENVANAHYRFQKLLDESSAEYSSSTVFSEVERHIASIEQRVNTKYLHHTIDAKIAQLEKMNNEVSNVEQKA